MKDQKHIDRRQFTLKTAAGAIALLLTSGLHGTENSGKLKLLSYNVWYGFSEKAERKDNWLKFMNDQAPDIVSLQELNDYTPEKLAGDARKWGHTHSVLLKEDGFPTGITSSQSITEVKRMTEGFHHGLLSCKTHGIHVYSIHLHPGNWEIRLREVELLLKEVAKLPPNAKVVLVGDFNTFSPHDKAAYDQADDMIPFFKRLDIRTKGKNLRNGQLDYRHLKNLEDAGFVDLIHRKRKAFIGTFPTPLRAGEDMGPDRRLDYILASPGLAASCLTAKCIVNETTGLLSDHQPVSAVFDFPVR
ncbi:MAG: endonuclease/exonuclease/phosphatase family protein [Verrucomicrobiota bacterium]|nr:endonuclease/exonuclease/phosphatase family protein [Verrucomicrobiota bacterium]